MNLSPFIENLLKHTSLLVFGLQQLVIIKKASNNFAILHCLASYLGDGLDPLLKQNLCLLLLHLNLG
jgi:hypothetical protein